MKISPVQGTPTIPQPSATGLSPEKLERLKTIAAGQKPEDSGNLPETFQKDSKNLPNPSQSIKMNVNRTPEQAIAEKIIEAQETESGISDAGVQASPAPEAIQPLSPQLAALAKQRRLLQVKEKELADKEKALNADNGWAEREKRMKSGQALSVLQELGVTYDQLTNEILGKQANGDIDAVISKIASLEKSIDERLAAKDTEQEKAVFNHMKKTVDKLTFSSNDFRLIRESKSQDDVMGLIKQEWEQNGEVLDEEEACRRIEGVLREDAKRYAKVMSELEPTPVAQPVPQTGLKTLTNKDSARPLMNRKQRAIAAMQGQK